MAIAHDLGIPTVERAVDRSELLIADEVFLCGTAARIAPVSQIEGYLLPEKRPLTEGLRQKLVAIAENRDPQYRDWVDVIACHGDGYPVPAAKTPL